MNGLIVFVALDSSVYLAQAKTIQHRKFYFQYFKLRRFVSYIRRINVISSENKNYTNCLHIWVWSDNSKVYMVVSLYYFYIYSLPLTVFLDAFCTVSYYTLFCFSSFLPIYVSPYHDISTVYKFIYCCSACLLVHLCVCVCVCECSFQSKKKKY